MQKRSASEAKLNNKFKNRSNDHTQVKEMRPQAKEKWTKSEATMTGNAHGKATLKQQRMEIQTWATMKQQRMNGNWKYQSEAKTNHERRKSETKVMHRRTEMYKWSKRETLYIYYIYIYIYIVFHVCFTFTFPFAFASLSFHFSFARDSCLLHFCISSYRSFVVASLLLSFEFPSVVASMLLLRVHFLSPIPYSFFWLYVTKAAFKHAHRLRTHCLKVIWNSSWFWDCRGVTSDAFKTCQPWITGRPMSIALRSCFLSKSKP